MESVRKLVSKLDKGAKAFRSRPLPGCVVFMDGTYVPLKRSYGETSSVSKECIEVARRKTRARIQYNSEDSALIVLAKVYEDYNRDARPAKFMLELSEEEKQSMGFNG